MKPVNDILEELRSMGSPLADISRKMPYSVPSGYFGELDVTLQAAILAESNEPAIPGNWTKSMPFEAPAGYFSDLPTSINLRARLSERLEELPRTMPLTIPSGYFDQFPDKIRVAAQASEPSVVHSKTIPLVYRKTTWSLKWVAAAVILIMATIGGIEMLYTHPAYVSDKILASVPGEDIHEYLKHSTGIKLDVDQVINNNSVYNLSLDNKDIIDYLNETGWD